MASVGIEEKNEAGRFERAFRGVPREAWHVFEEPGECLQVMADALGREY